MDDPVAGLLRYGPPQVVNKSQLLAEKDHSGNVLGFFSREDELDFQGIAEPKGKPEIYPPACLDKLEQQDILHFIEPPRIFGDGLHKTKQQVSSVPATRADTLDLQRRMARLMKSLRGNQYGTCSVRRNIYKKAFDELIRSASITCAERGLLMIYVRNDLEGLLESLRKLYFSAVAYGLRKSLKTLDTDDEALAVIEQVKGELEIEKQRFGELMPQMESFVEKTELEVRAEEDKFAELLDALVKRKDSLKNLVIASVVPKKGQKKPAGPEKGKRMRSESVAESVESRASRIASVRRASIKSQQFEQSNGEEEENE